MESPFKDVYFGKLFKTNDGYSMVYLYTHYSAIFQEYLVYGALETAPNSITSWHLDGRSCSVLMGSKLDIKLQ